MLLPVSFVDLRLVFIAYSKSVFDLRLKFGLVSLLAVEIGLVFFIHGSPRPEVGFDFFQELRKGVLAKGVSAESSVTPKNKNHPKILVPAVHLAL